MQELSINNQEVNPALEIEKLISLTNVKEEILEQELRENRLLKANDFPIVSL